MAYSFINPENSDIVIPESNILNGYSELGLDKLFGKESILFYSDDAETIRFRQEVIKDVINHSNALDAMKIFIDSYDKLKLRAYGNDIGETNKSLLTEISSAGKYSVMMSEMTKDMTEITDFSSDGMNRLCDIFVKETATKEFMALVSHISKIPENISDAKSITIAINLDENFEPSESGIVSVNDYLYMGSSIIERILRMDFSGDAPRTLAPILKTDEKDPVKMFDFNRMAMSSINKMILHQLKSLRVDVEKIISYDLRILSGLADEMKFIIRSAEVINALTEYGVPFIYPSVSGEITEISDCYDIRLEYERKILGYPFKKQTNIWKKSEDISKMSQLMYIYHLGFPVPAERVISCNIADT